MTGSLKELKDEDEEEEEKWSQRQLEFMELLNKLQVWSSAMYIEWVRFECLHESSVTTGADPTIPSTVLCTVHCLSGTEARHTACIPLHLLRP